MPDLRALDPLSVVAALVVGIVLGVGLGWIFHGSEAPVVAGTPAATGERPGTPPPPPPPPGPNRETAARRGLAVAMRNAVRDAGRYGRLEAAAMIDGSPVPVVRPKGDYTQMRAWSMAKAVTALTLLLHTHAASYRELDRYLEAALRRSDNCAQRKLTLMLQTALRRPEETRKAIARTVELAGAHIDVATPVADPDGAPDCATASYPAALRLTAPEAAATTATIQLGTTRWGVRDAVRFAYALRSSAAGDGPYDKAAARRIRGLMRARKLPSQEPGAAAQFTAQPSWGAGEVFTDPCWKLAYKAGWGGSDKKNFLAGQLGTVELENGHWVAFALMFHPSVQPANDDPGKVHAAEVIRQAMTTLQVALNRLGGCR